MRSARLSNLALATLVCLTSVCAYAEQDGPAIKFSGFGTLGAAVTDTSELGFRSSVRQSAGATTQPDFGVDSRIGLQTIAEFTSDISATLQLLSSRRDNAQGPQVEWLFGQARVNPWLKLRAGRMVSPAFMKSDSRNVGYSSHWLRAPAEVYDLYHLSSFDGVQALASGLLENAKWSLQTSIGSARGMVFSSGKTTPPNFESTSAFRRLRSYSFEFESEPWTFRLSQTFADLKLTADTNPSAPTRTFDKFTSLGLQYDDAKFLVRSEIGSRRQANGASNSDGAYLTGGYYLGAWLPYATLGYFYTHRNSLQALSNGGDTSIALGVRWDFRRSLDLKLQFESIKVSRDRPAVPQFVDYPTTLSTSRVNALSVALDFVF